MKKIIAYGFLILLLFSCTSTNKDSKKNNKNYILSEISQEASYGYEKSNPIKTGFGPQGQRYFLNQLAGPLGEEISYERIGSCCSFKTKSPDAIMGMGMLDIYLITISGNSETVKLFLNMYDFELPKIPQGFSLKN
ncbi:MAG: hypothetical protein JXR63_07015 [Spirochaetales bacterium]|nr:hypothetical protein [Spirochaetales bacterium]